MSNETTQVAPGVVRHDCGWNRFHYLEGSRQALIASGLVRPEWLPNGERDSRGRVKRTRKSWVDGRLIQATKTSTHRHLVYFHRTPEEQGRAEGRWEYDKALADEQKELRGMPRSHEDYREETARTVEYVIDQMAIKFFCVPREFHGYYYAPEVIEELQIKVQEIREILEDGRTLFDRKAHQKRIAEVKSKTASADPELRKFLDSLQTTK